MGYSKEFMLEGMANMLAEMSPALEFAGVKISMLQIPEDAKEFKADFIRPAFHWLDSVYETEFKAYSDVRDLCSEEVWKRYFLWGDYEDHREVIMLREAAAVLKKRIYSKERADFFKKGKQDGQRKAARRKGDKTKTGV